MHAAAHRVPPVGQRSLQLPSRAIEPVDVGGPLVVIIRAGPHVEPVLQHSGRRMCHGNRERCRRRPSASVVGIHRRQRQPVPKAADRIQLPIPRARRHRHHRFRQAGHFGPVRPVVPIDVRPAPQIVHLVFPHRRGALAAARRQSRHFRPVRPVKPIYVGADSDPRIAPQRIQSVAERRHAKGGRGTRQSFDLRPRRPVPPIHVRHGHEAPRLHVLHAPHGIHGTLEAPRSQIVLGHRQSGQFLPAADHSLESDPPRRIVDVRPGQRDVAVIRGLHHDVHRAIRAGRRQRHRELVRPGLREGRRRPAHQDVRDRSKGAARHRDRVPARERTFSRRHLVAHPRQVQHERRIRPVVGKLQRGRMRPRRRRRKDQSKKPAVSRIQLAGHAPAPAPAARFVQHREHLRRRPVGDGGADRQRLVPGIADPEFVGPAGPHPHHGEVRARLKPCHFAAGDVQFPAFHRKLRRRIREDIAFDRLAVARRLHHHIAKARGGRLPGDDYNLSGRYALDRLRRYPAQRHVRDVRAIAQVRPADNHLVAAGPRTAGRFDAGSAGRGGIPIHVRDDQRAAKRVQNAIQIGQ